MIYRKAFESGDLGYASALSVILFFIVLVISAVQLRTFDRLTTDV
jgi:ABC-type sugar transport system permease subunit